MNKVAYKEWAGNTIFIIATVKILKNLCFLQFSLKFLPLVNVLKKICFTLGRICQDIPSQGLKNLKTAILLTKDSVSCPNRSIGIRIRQSVLLQVK